MKNLGVLRVLAACRLPAFALVVPSCSAGSAESALRATAGAAGAAGAADAVGGVAGSSNAGGASANAAAGIGAGGSSNPSAAGTAGTAGVGAGGSGAGGAGAGTGGSAPATCPANAFFCSGFEDTALPTGATYLSSNDNNDWTKGTLLDQAVFHDGAQSIQILKSTSYSQREVVVPAAVTFWFRAYLRTDVMIGGPDGANHNLFFEAAYPGGDKGVEVVEEDCELGMNINDTRYGSNGMVNQPGCPATPATQLAANVWHCLEGYFDGSKGDFRLFANGTEVVTQTGIAGAKQAFSTLRFGYREYHPHDRVVWYDDVVTAPDRIGCQ
ncbi:MAG TPA: hypothetical protein VNW92_08825 [Polyangiaceae bacterium]|nr:hypothetical protein [Polyangiaceae bacterium]